MEKTRSMPLRRIVRIALMAAVLCVLSPLAIPLSTQVPLSLATFAVMLSGALLGSKDGTFAVLTYILLGAAGLPVFANYRAGADVLFGVTGGFILGYLPLAYLTARIPELTKKHGQEGKRIPLTAIGALAGTAVLYLMGTVWFVLFAKATPAQALAACVLPFLPGDLVKIAAVCLLSPRILAAMEQAEKNR